MVRSQAASDRGSACGSAPRLTIAALAAAGGVGIETVRYYQRRGLLRTPQRSGPTGGIRRYGEADVHALRFIRAAQAAGFSLDEIGRLLALDATEDRAAARALTATRIAALDAQIAGLQKARSALRGLAQACGDNAAGPCPILAAFDRG